VTIGLAGWYHKGNFGDDLMAMMITKKLVREELDVVLWGIDEEEAMRWGATSIRERQSFLSMIDVLVFGGGGLLANADIEDDFDKFLKSLVEGATNRGVAIHGISLGGDGSLTPSTISPGRKALLENISLLTVRNPQDVGDVAQFGVDSSFHHDIVWRCEEYISRSKRSNNVSREWGSVIVNIEEKSKVRKLFVLISSVYGSISPQRFRYMGIISRDENLHNMQKFLGHNGIINYEKYESVESCLRKIQRSSLVVSSKMHIGICSMALGGDFLSIFGVKKTKIMMGNINKKGFFIGKSPVKFLDQSRM